MIDLHSHVLPGIDDGPATVEGSLAMLRAAAAAGTTTITATPHVSGTHRNDPGSISAAAEMLAAARADEGEEIAIEVRLGAEVAYTMISELDREELPRLCLGDGPWLLLEPPFSPVVAGLDATVAELHRRDHRVLLAHPERCPAFHRDPGLVEAMVDGGVLTSVTAGSLAGRFGSQARRMALWLLDRGLAHNVASDAHDARNRSPSIMPGLRDAGRPELADWLTRDVPAAILAGEEIPPRPAVAAPAPRRRLAWLRGGG